MTWDDSDSDDIEYEEFDNEETELTVPCVNCGREMYIDADMCPHCLSYQVDGERQVNSRPLSLRGRPVWYVLLALAGIAATIYVMLVGF